MVIEVEDGVEAGVVVRRRDRCGLWLVKVVLNGDEEGDGEVY